MRKLVLIVSATIVLTIWGSTDFSSVQTLSKTPPLAPHLLVASLCKQVSALTRGQPGAASIKSLLFKLDDAAQSLREGDGAGAIHHLSVFQLELQGLTRGGVIDSKSAAPILDTATAAQEGIQHILTLPIAVMPPPQVCADSSKCVYLTLYVARPTLFGHPPSMKPDGSPDAPFPTIADAIAQAKAAGACGLTVHLDRGLYIENVLVSLPLAIHGSGSFTVIQGSVLDYGGYDLGVSDLQIQRSPSPGAIVVDGCPSQTHISNVQIVDSTRNGVLQRGGSLSATQLSVRSTRATADDRKSGTGVRLGGGVHAVLGGLLLTQNGAAGLIAEGAETAVYVTSSSVTLNEINRYFPVDATTATQTLGSGIIADDGAYLLAEFTTVDRNQYIGLYVRGGATAHQRYSPIQGTSSVSTFAGYNVVNISSTLQLTAATLSDPDIVDLDASDSATTISASRVWRAPFLFSYFQGDHGTSTECLRLDGTELILSPGSFIFGFDPYHLTFPCPDCPVPPPLPCVAVPFDCWWCAS